MNPLFGLQDQQTTVVSIGLIQNAKFAPENYQNGLCFQKQRCVEAAVPKWQCICFFSNE